MARAELISETSEKNCSENNRLWTLALENNCVDILQSNHMTALRSLASELQLTCRHVQDIFSRCPKILCQSLETELFPFIDYLCTTLNVGKSFVGRIALNYPTILSSCVKKNADSVIYFLVEECKLDQDQLRKMIYKRPQLLTLRVESNLRPTVGS